LQLTGLKIGERAVVTSVRLDFRARKQLLTYGVGLGTIISREYSPQFTALIQVNINGKSICIRQRDASMIEVIKYDEV